MPETKHRLARLRVGLAAARAVVGFRVDGEPRLVEDEDVWLVPVTLTIGTSSVHVPSSTSWLLRVDVGYPYGGIELFPANAGGMTATFQHQELNLALGGRYRHGKICLENPYRLKLIASNGNDPVGDADARIAWYVRRAVVWLDRAARADLVRDGDPFEIPRCVALREPTQLVHDESPVSLAAWAGRERSWGRVTLCRLPDIEKTLFAARFHDASGATIREGAVAVAARDERIAGTVQGVWWLWPQPIVLPPWQVPVTWKDLRIVGQAQQVDVNRTLQAIVSATRGRGRVVLMLGYPIPRAWGGPPVEIHWQAIDVGELERGKPANGFRANESGWWQRDLSTKFNGSKVMIYTNTENWHPDRLQARGRVSAALCDKKVAIIGCGSLGSILAQLLVRAGVRRALLVDGQDLEIGNLVRHVLTAKDVGKNKANALAALLRTASPLADVTAYDGMLPTEPQDVHELLEDCDVVIDCTASNDVPALLAATWWSVPPLFVSASVGFEARRTFLYRAQGHRFPAVHFHSELGPWLALEEAAWAESGEQLEGAGCYSPLFRARIDDVTMSAVAALRFIEEAVAKDELHDELLVLEKSGLVGHTVAALPAAPTHAAAV